MKYYQVRYGHRENECVSVSEDEMPTAIKAQVTGKIGVFKEGTISGSSIIAVVPDYQRIMGWNRSYALGPEDWAQIQENEECTDARLLLEGTVNQIRRPERNAPALTEGAKQLAQKMGEPTWDR